MSTLRSGVVEYRERAFEQDAAEAIRGDIIRALIELITNADDAYSGDPGSITVVVERTDDADYPLLVRVHDRARGLFADAMISNFAVLGNERDAKEGTARGLFGRGAKDVVTLGKVSFKAVKDGGYSELALDNRGHWRMLAENDPASPDHRADLALAESDNGLTVDLAIKAGVQVPSRLRLQDKIAQHAQLRDLVKRRQVILHDKRDRGSGPVELQAPAELGDVVIDENLTVEGYEPVHLVVRKLSQRSQGGITPYSPHGLLVKSGVSTFENTWFDLEGRQEASFFAGTIEAPQVSEIIRAYDKGDASLGGPTRLLSRSRDGLIKEHPYRRALSAAITARVKPVFDELAQSMDADRHQGAELDKALNVAREALREHIRELLEELDEAEEGVDTDVVAPLAVIPPRRVAKPNESLSFTLRASSRPMGELMLIVDDASSPDSIASVADSSMDWVTHSRLNAVQRTFYVTAGSEEGTGLVRAEVDGLSAFVTIIVREPSDTDIEPPVKLEVSPIMAHVAPQRRKRLLVRVPMSLEGVSVDLSCDVTLVQVPASVVLRSEPGGRWVQAVVVVEAGANPGTANVKVRTDEETAQAKIVIEESPVRGGLDMDFELSGYKRPARRSELVPEGGALKVRVFPLHASFDGVFGKYSEEQAKFSGEDSAPARAILAEVIASELAGYFTERDYDKRPDRLDDAPRVLRRRAEISSRLLLPLHRALRPQG